MKLSFLRKRYDERKKKLRFLSRLFLNFEFKAELDEISELSFKLIEKVVKVGKSLNAVKDRFFFSFLSAQGNFLYVLF